MKPFELQPLPNLSVFKPAALTTLLYPKALEGVEPSPRGLQSRIFPFDQRATVGERFELPNPEGLHDFQSCPAISSSAPKIYFEFDTKIKI